MGRLWSWWKRVANDFAREVYLDDPVAVSTRRTSTLTNPPLSIGEKLLLLLFVAVIAGGVAWQVAIDRRSEEEQAAAALDDFVSEELGLNEDSWVRQNPRTFGVGIGVGVYILGVLTIVAIEQRPKADNSE